MNLADQIDTMSRRATGEVIEASQAYSDTQRHLAAEFAEHEQETASAQELLRRRLEFDADLAENATPRIMLPADVAEASPHRAPRTE